MHKELNKLKGKKIAILGLGIENYALVNFLLQKKINSYITICDHRAAEELGERYGVLKHRKLIAWKLGKSANQDLDGFDIIFRSPGWPVFDPKITKAVKMGVELSSPIKLFFKICPTKNIIGVTGTKGKGTTSALIKWILDAANKNAWLGGNIGIAPFDFINKIRKTDWVILELSSFQLEDLDTSSHIAVITNFVKEHLSPADPNNPNHHKSLIEYWISKLNLIRWQRTSDYAVANKRLKKRLAKESRICKFGNGKKLFFARSNWKSKIVGNHNQENIAAAITVGKILKIKDSIMKKAVAEFPGLEHRVELCGKAKGVLYYDDSFATTPEAAITAINSFHSPVILLAGGADKGSNFKSLARKIKQEVHELILFRGRATPRLKREVIATGYSKRRIYLVDSMKKAVDIARKKANPGNVVLLSPGCASFGLFKNYKERGNLFKEEIKKLL